MINSILIGKQVTRTIIFLSFVLATLSAPAQKGHITGQVYDEQHEESIPFANVAVFGSDFHDLVAGGVSDENGTFEMKKIPYGSYHIIISFIGFTTDTLSQISISEENHKVELGRINLTPTVISLGEVEVRGTATAVTTELDRRTYNASEFEAAKGGTAVDLLNRLPSISVGSDGNVSLRGTTQFMVYLNGKPTQLEPSVLLAQLSADAIENIEVITVPTARYDAQGKGGIINIETKRQGAEGLSVSANALIGGAPWGQLTDPLSGYELNDTRYGGTLNLVYGRERSTFYGGIYYNKKNVNGDRVGDARILQEDGSYYHMVAVGERPEWYRNFTANVGADFKVNDRSTFSAAYYYGDRKEGRSAFYVYNNFYGDINKDPVPGIPADDQWIYNPNTDNRYGIFHSGNIDYKIEFDNNSNLSTSMLYEHSSLSRSLDNRDYAYDKPGETPGSLQRHFMQADDAPLDGVRIAIDYDRTFDNGNTLAIGLQPQFLRHTGTFDYDTFNVEQGEWGSYSELENAVDLYRGVYAGYGDYSGKTDRFEYSFGLRLEYTDQTLEMENPDYFNIFDRPAESTYEVKQLDWFPALHLNWSLSESENLIFAGSRRINRPPTKNMAPFLYRRHYEVYVVGDPALKPEYISNLELTYDRWIGNQNIALTGFYRGTENAIFRVNTVYQEENVLIRSYTNSGNTQSLGAELNGNLEIGGKITMFVGGSLYNYRVKGDIFGYRENNQSTNWSLKGNFNWKASSSFKFTADFDFKSATVTAQGTNELFYLANAVITYTPPASEHWSFALRGMDLLASNVEGLNTRAFDSAGTEIFYQEVQYNRYGPILEFGVNYAFNSNGKTKKKAKKTFGDEQF
ncbi:MAG: TonB-dependent receptor family protein [Cytophagales bacterium]|nr:TonB-dependent receptor family protein [Cytophagales bacterium]